MRIKTAIITFMLSINLCATGIPVVDIAGNAQTMAQNLKEILEWAKEAKRWAETSGHYKEQLNAYAKELATQTGVRDVVGFSKDLQNFYNFSKKYSQDFLTLKDDILNTDPSSELGKMAQQLFEKYSVFKNCEEDYYSVEESKFCKTKKLRTVQNIAVYQTYAKQLTSTSNNLQSLAEKVTKAKDTKESQDIANAINLELLKLQVQKQQIYLYNSQQEKLAKIDNRRASERHLKIMSSPSKLNFEGLGDVKLPDNRND